MAKIRVATTVFFILIWLLSIVSCDRLTGSSNVKKPTQVVDVSSMVGKSLQEMTTMLGQATERCPTCGYTWEFPEGVLNVSYELGDYSKRWMSSIDYKLKPDFAVSSTEEMTVLLNINVQGKEAEKHHKGFFTYKDININGKSGWVDVHPQAANLIFGQQNPAFTFAELYINNPEIRFYPRLDRDGVEKTFWEQQTDINVSVGSVALEDGDWEVCTGANFTGKCKILEDKVDSEYWKNNKNFSSFGLGTIIKSFRPVKLQ